MPMDTILDYVTLEIALREKSLVKKKSRDLSEKHIPPYKCILNDAINNTYIHIYMFYIYYTF